MGKSKVIDKLKCIKFNSLQLQCPSNCDMTSNSKYSEYHNRSQNHFAKSYISMIY